jgi:hypothetical protein
MTNSKVDADPSAALDAGIAEANRLSKGQFDGLLGSLPTGSSKLLQMILDELRWVLLENYTDDEAKALLREFEPRPGFRNMSVVSGEVELAIRLMNLIASTLRCEGDRRINFLFGPKEAARRSGSRKGGRSRSEPEWWDAAESEAWRLLKAGTTPANLVGKLLPKFDVDARTLRRVLRERLVLPRKVDIK